MEHLEVSGAVRYIYVVRQLMVKIPWCIYNLSFITKRAKISGGFTAFFLLANALSYLVSLQLAFNQQT